MKKLRFVAPVLALLMSPLAAASIQGVKPEEVGFSSERTPIWLCSRRSWKWCERSVAVSKFGLINTAALAR